MGPLAQYAMHVALMLAAFCLVYRWTLASATFHRFNRAVLMCGIILAYASVPLLMPGGAAEAAPDTPEAQAAALRAEIASLSESPMPM